MEKLYKIKTTKDDWDEVASVRMIVRLSDDTGKRKEVSAVTVLGFADKTEAKSMSDSELEADYLAKFKLIYPDEELEEIFNREDEPLTPVPVDEGEDD